MDLTKEKDFFWNAGVKEQVYSDYRTADPSGLTPKQLLPLLSEKIHSFAEKQYSCLNRSIVPSMKRHNINFLHPKEMNSAQLEFISNYFDKVLFPVLTPLAVDKSRPFPLLTNKSLNIAVRLKNDDESYFAVVQVPSIISRFLKIPSEQGTTYTLLENVIIYKLKELFESKSIMSAYPFRITRNSDLDIDEEAEDLLIEIQKSIKKRKRGRPVRLELTQKFDEKTKEFLVEMLDINEDEIYELTGPLDLTFFSKFASQHEYNDLCFEPIEPVYPPADFWGYDDIFEAIREKDRMLHHPYESFQTVVDFVKKAAEDKNVLAIKQTLYRVSGNSPIVEALIKAAENGKQVTVLVELKARFDEENNFVGKKT